RRDDRVVGAHAAQGAVGQFGGQAGVTGGQPPLPDQVGQQEVGVGVPFVHGAQHVEGGGACEVARRTAPPAAGSPVAPPRPAAVPAAHAFTRHSNRSPSAMRAPLAHSAAVIARLPWGRTSPSRTGWVAVPTSTAFLVADSAPGASAAASGAGRTGPSFTLPPRNSVHAPGAGVQALIRRSTRKAGADQSTLAASTVILGA